MTAPRAKLKWGRRGWERIEQPAPADHHHHLLVSAIHTLAARVTSLEQQFAKLNAPAVKPTRSRKPCNQGKSS
jgi:hypothetical protein